MLMNKAFSVLNDTIILNRVKRSAFPLQQRILGADSNALVDFIAVNLSSVCQIIDTGKNAFKFIKFFLSNVLSDSITAKLPVSNYLAMKKFVFVQVANQLSVLSRLTQRNCWTTCLAW